MKQTLQLFIVLISALAIKASAQVTVTLDGKAIVSKPWNAYSFDVEYGPAGFTSGSGTYQGQIYTGTVTYQLNPFAAYDFRIRSRDMWGTAGPWSEPVTINSCSVVPQPVGYSFDFNTSPLDACWRGYKNPYGAYAPISQSTEYYHGDSGSSILMSANFFNGYAYLVSPKLSDLGTDKKFSFWVKLYSSGTMVAGTVGTPNDPSTFHQLQVVAGNTSGDWTKVTVYTNNYNGSDSYFMIKFRGGYQSSDSAYIDDFSYEQAVTCLDVSNTSVDNISEHGAHLSFDAAPGQTQWQVSVKNLLTSQVSDVVTSQTSLTFDNLVGNTDYAIKVRAICGTDQFSNWSPELNITTSCQELEAGYSTSFYDSNILDPCWKAIVPTNTIVAPVGNYINGSEVVLSPRTGAKMIEMSSWFGVGPDYLITPYFSDLDANKMIRFYLTTRTSDSDLISLTIGTINNPADPTTFHPIQVITNAEMNQSPDNMPNWKEHTVYFNNYNSDHNDHYIAFRFMPESDYAAGTLFMDDFSYDNIPACPAPIYPKAIATDFDAATLTWQSFQNSTATAWEIEYGPEGFVPGTGTFVTVQTNPFKVENLVSDDANYDFYVRAKCGNVNSDWSVKGSFQTRCIGVSVGYTDSFESYPVGGFDSCWSSLMPFYPVGTFQYLDFVSIASSGSPNYYPAHSGTHVVRYANNESTPVVNESEKTIFITPRLIDFDHFKNISFWMFAQPSAYFNPNSIIIGTMSDPSDYTTFTPFKTINNAAQFEGQWKKYTIDFSNYSGTDKYVGIRQGQSNGDTVLFFDDFEYGGVSCTTPSNLSAQQSGNTTVTVGWNNNMPQTPASWTIEYGPKGFTPGAGTMITANSNPFEIQGLTLFQEYEFRVRNNCTTTTSGDFSTKYVFKATCAVTAPFEDNFDQYASNYNIPPDFCWTTNDQYRSALTAFCYDGANSCPNAIRLYTHLQDSFEPESHGTMASPYLSDFDNHKAISFWIKRSGSSLAGSGYHPVVFVGTLSNPMDFSTFTPYQSVDLDNLPDMGREFTVDFSNYTGNSKHIAFMHDGVYDYDYLYIDNFKYFSTASGCLAPINVRAQNINSDSATIVWDPVNASGSYTLEYGAPGFVPGTGTSLTVSNPELELTSLTPSTNYEYYIRSNCGDISSENEGPNHFATTCDVITALPWIENFDSMPAYGENILPPCFRTTSNEDFESRNQIIDYLTIDYDNLITGVGDTHFLFMNGFYHNFHTPLFSLQAGTTYSFSLMARKGYEYSPVGILASTGRGNTAAAMDVRLTNLGTLTEYHYNQQLFYFTPLVSGDYGFLLSVQSSGGTNKILDQFKVAEGYNETITDNEELFDFEGPSSNKLIIESTQTSHAEIVESQGQHFLRMGGGEDNAWKENGNPWLDNENSVTKVNLKIDAQSMTSLYLSFNLKQTFATASQNSAFRLVVNGAVFGDVLYPVSQNGDAADLKIYDLSAFTGGAIHISLQHLGRSANGDNAELDNIAFTNSILNVDTADQDSVIRVFPNPAKAFAFVKSSVDVSRIELVNMSGQLLYAVNNPDRETKVALEGLASGLYLIKIITANRNYLYKVIKN